MLKRLEEVEKDHYYFHSYNPIFDAKYFTKIFELKNFLGCVPSQWRRFAPEDWEKIKLFLKQNEINLIINLRNEGPLRDKGYFQFKEAVANTGIEFWELDQNELIERKRHQHLIKDQIDLFKKNRIDISSVNHFWLRDYIKKSGKSRPKAGEIGFFTGASQDVKRWTELEWVKLGRLFLKRTDYKIVVYAGQSQAELLLAQNTCRQLQTEFSENRISLFKDQSLDLLCEDISGLDLMISNDTFCVHMASALDVPAIGLYFSTNSDIWGGLSDKFLAMQSQFGLGCREFKKDAGNCNFYYAGCIAPCKNEITPEKVFEASEAHILSKQLI